MLAAAPQEPNGQHTERKRATREDQRLTPSERLDFGDELVRVALAHVAAHAFDLLGAAIDVLGQRRLCAALAKVLPRLA
jgi:hypothetical protein